MQINSLMCLFPRISINTGSSWTDRWRWIEFCGHPCNSVYQIGSDTHGGCGAGLLFDWNSTFIEGKLFYFILLSKIEKIVIN